MREKIIEMLEDKVSELFIELYENNGITTGDINPLDQFQLSELQEQMADIIYKVAKENRDA